MAGHGSGPRDRPEAGGRDCTWPLISTCTAVRKGAAKESQGKWGIREREVDHARLRPWYTAVTRLFPATQDVHDGDVRGGDIDSGIPGIWRRVGGHGGADLVMVSRRGEQLAAVSVVGVVAGMAVPGTGGR